MDLETIYQDILFRCMIETARYPLHSQHLQTRAQD